MACRVIGRDLVERVTRSIGCLHNHASLAPTELRILSVEGFHGSRFRFCQAASTSAFFYFIYRYTDFCLCSSHPYILLMLFRIVFVTVNGKRLQRIIDDRVYEEAVRSTDFSRGRLHCSRALATVRGIIF